MNQITFKQIAAIGLVSLLYACGGSEKKPAPGTEPAKNPTSSEESILGDATRGKSLYATCATCHGQQAEGMKALGAPALADQEPYYLKNQLQNFRTNKRGVHAKDVYGAQMAPMAKTLDSQGIKDVIAYIKTFPSPKVETTLESGSVANGEAYYNMVCGACHGPGAVGIESLFSPRLIGMQDWYLERQLNNFRDSIRGVEPGDTYGAQMQQIAQSIPDDQTVSDLIAYINSLSAE
ncbi:MAG: c-type cytochrome [Flavobacteriales bacterium]|nr:c-type cytochrome [Flavobacteriales bacterium]